MSRIAFTDELQADYRRLFTTCVIRADKGDEVEVLAAAIEADQDRYRSVAEALGVPWFVVAVLHAVERQRDFSVHFHNGDPLTERTRHQPDGRPRDGKPPFPWEDSASDALRLRFLDQWHDWSLTGTLFKLEEYGGWGYRLHHPDVPSPYLWGGSTHYDKGKYVTDDTWSDTAVFTPCGAAVLLRRLAERGRIDFPDANPETLPALRYAETGSPSPWVAELQGFLNRFPGLFVKVDGLPGPRTSEALHKLTGHYLQGDPRNAQQTTEDPPI
jgi:lysozyme family protein